MEEALIVDQQNYYKLVLTKCREDNVCNHKDIVNIYENIFKKNLSVEVKILIFERLNHSLELEEMKVIILNLILFLKKNNKKFSF